MKIKPTNSLLLSIIILLVANPAFAQKCNKANFFMEVAWRSDAKDDFWTGFANCKNMHGLSWWIDAGKMQIFFTKI